MYEFILKYHVILANTVLQQETEFVLKLILKLQTQLGTVVCQCLSKRLNNKI